MRISCRVIAVISVARIHKGKRPFENKYAQALIGSLVVLAPHSQTSSSYIKAQYRSFSRHICKIRQQLGSLLEHSKVCRGAKKKSELRAPLKTRSLRVIGTAGVKPAARPSFRRSCEDARSLDRSSGHSRKVRDRVWFDYNLTTVSSYGHLFCMNHNLM